MFDKANSSSSCGRSTFNSILSVGRLSGIKESHVLLEERLPPEHQVREYRLVRRGITEMLIAGEDIMNKSRTTPPMPQDKQGVHLQRLISQFLEPAILDRLQGAQQAANTGRKAILPLKPLSICCRHLPERIPIRPDQRIDRQLIKLQQSHILSFFRYTFHRYALPAQLLTNLTDRLIILLSDSHLREVQGSQSVFRHHIFSVHTVDDHTHGGRIIRNRIDQDKRAGLLIPPIRIEEQLLAGSKYHTLLISFSSDDPRKIAPSCSRSPYSGYYPHGHVSYEWSA